VGLALLLEPKAWSLVSADFSLPVIIEIGALTHRHLYNESATISQGFSLHYLGDSPQ
jgi:hypothetical protein